MEEIRIAVLGNVDSAKTTLVSTITNKILDDGRGFARGKVFKHKHEKDTGRLKSNIVYNTIIQLDEEVKEKEQIEEIILVKVPSEIYPDLRKIFVFNFESSGFKNIKIEEKVDFMKLYKSKGNQ